MAQTHIQPDLKRCILELAETDNTLEYNSHAQTDSLIQNSPSPIADSILFETAYSIAAHFMQTGQWKKAIDIYIACIAYFHPQNYGSKARQTWSSDTLYFHDFANLQIALGVAYEESGLRYMAMETYQEAMRTASTYGWKKEQAMLFNNMANIYWKLGELDKAKNLWDSAIVINTQIHSQQELVRNYLNLAGWAFSQGDNTQVFDYLFLAQKFLDKEKDSALYYNIRFNAAATYQNIGELDIALQNIREAISFYKNENNYASLSLSYLAIASIFEKQNRKDSALFYARKAFETAPKSSSLSLYKQALDLYSHELAQTEQLEKAYNLLVERCKISDSLYAADTREQLGLMEAAYETERKNQQNELRIQDLEIKNLTIQKRNLFLILICALVLATGLLIFARYRYQKQNHLKEKILSEERERKLIESLEIKNQQLTSNVLRLVKNNESAIGIGKELQKLLLELSPRDQSKKKHIEQLMINLRNMQNEGTYAEFHYYFEQVHQSFYNNLKAQYPNLTYRDQRLCAFLRLGLSTKEIATISFKTIRSVEASRNRLRKKMNLPLQENLIEFLSRF